MFDIYNQDCLTKLKELEADSIDSCVTDPPYGLSKEPNIAEVMMHWCNDTTYEHKSNGFMGKNWDSFVPSPEYWKEVFRVLKPGGHALIFAGTRTQDLMSIALRFAGFEIRDVVMWVYGCLDASTQVATKDGVKHYHETKLGDLVLCYDVDTNTYTYQPILEIVEYDYADTAYRLVGDFGEQVVSRNHRVIVERNGKETFQFAETCEHEIRIPVLESLPALQQALHGINERASTSQQVLREDLSRASNCIEANRADYAYREAQTNLSSLRGMSEGISSEEFVVAEGSNANMQLPMQRCTTRGTVEATCSQGQSQLVGSLRDCIYSKNDGRNQSSMEGGVDLSESQGCVCSPSNKVCTLSTTVTEHGEERRVCYGAPPNSSGIDGTFITTSGSSTSSQSQCDRQCCAESNGILNECGTQEVRAWSGHKAAMVRVVPFQYTGKVWCLRVSTGAFVAVRNGVAFPTGNSGFPKSLNISKSLDKMAVAKREVIGVKAGHEEFVNRKTKGHIDFKGATEGYDRPWMHDDAKRAAYHLETAPATEAAKQWDGWGTALKPAYEPVIMVRKPVEGTIAANVSKNGVGGINIDACRVGTTKNVPASVSRAENGNALEGSKDGSLRKETGLEDEHNPNIGRFPANFIHDGSEEVTELFPVTTSGAMKREVEAYEGETVTGFLRGRSGPSNQHGDSGSAARFFYCAKTSKKDRGEGNMHPTVKPTDLIRYLCRLITPPNGTVIDPFMGSGSTGKAALLEGFKFIGIEKDQAYFDITSKRLSTLECFIERGEL